MNLAELKKNHRHIFCTYINGKNIYWRPLTLREYDTYFKIINLEITSLGKIQDQIFREVVLSEDIVDEMNLTPPGIIPSIVDLVFHISGNYLLNTNDMDRMNSELHNIRRSIETNPFEQFIILICKAFPTYTPNEIEDLEYCELLRLVIMAEKILGLEDPIHLKSVDEKKTRLTDTIFKDKSRAENVDKPVDPLLAAQYDIRNELNERQRQKDLSYKQARQIEMINRIKARRNQ